MTSPLLPQQRVRVIRIIHASLMAGIIAFLVVSVWKHRATPPPVESDFFATLRYVGLALLAATLVVLRLLPRPDPAPPPGQGADQWWVTSQGRLIAMWATMEGAALFNAVVWFMTRDPTPLAAAVVALVVLFVLRPGRYLDLS